MKNPTIIILVILVSLVVVGLLIYGFVVLPKQQADSLGTNTDTNTNTNTNTTTNTNTNTTTSTNTNTGASTAIKNLAQEFRDKFQCGSCASTRCIVIGKVNALSNAALRVFSAYYKTKFGITPKEEMDGAWVWCATNNVDDTLYQKLSTI